MTTRGAEKRASSSGGAQRRPEDPGLHTPGEKALMFSKVLIANRGEIALRVLRACKELGISTVAVHSTADADAMHVRLADESVCIGPPPATESYLNIPRIVSACEITGADAVHPGYGFLSENARFADILTAHGITFIGPSAEHIRTMGDKIQAKETAERLGIPVVPGSRGAIREDAEAMRLAADIGYPVLVKAAAGGGGRGMKVAETEADLSRALSTARSEARMAFGDDAVYIEKYLGRPRHIEVQVIGDGQGNAVHLGERDCSLQRRHQKVWEEAPSPALNDSERAKIGKTVSEAVANLGYSGAGTIEFLYEDGEFYFIEMNTRVQVEHPVTEAITGIDIVVEQLRVASGGTLSIRQQDVKFSGHAIECRINAEHPATFAPSPGKITYYHPPGGLGVRVDSAVYQGYSVPPYYDSLIGKLIVHGRDRVECMMRLRRALDEFVVDGIRTTIPLFQELVSEPDIANGAYDIRWLESFLAQRSAEEA
jgi:acetyl-CoA carboxylase biotin carboxylase subunit